MSCAAIGCLKGLGRTRRRALIAIAAVSLFGYLGVWSQVVHEFPGGERGVHGFRPRAAVLEAYGDTQPSVEDLLWDAKISDPRDDLGLLWSGVQVAAARSTLLLLWASLWLALGGLVRQLLGPPNPVRILAFTANALDSVRLDVERELREIRARVDVGPKGSRALALHVRHAAEPEDLPAALRELRPEVLHFSGHAEPAGLRLRGGAAGSERVGIESLCNVLEGRGLRLVVLNACLTDRLADALENVVPAVVGTSNDLGDEEAITFAASLYRGISTGLTVGEAFQDAIATIELEGGIDVYSLHGDESTRLVPVSG